MSWLKDSILILCQFQLMRLRRTKPPKMLWWSQNERANEKHRLGSTPLNELEQMLLIVWLLLPVSFFPEISTDRSSVKPRALYKCSVWLYHWGSNNTGSNTGVVKWPIFWGIGCWWADEEEGGSASWVVPNFVGTPTLPCIGEVVWLSGSLWGCKGLLQQGGE